MSPDELLCKEAGKRLYHILKAKGVDLMGVGVSTNTVDSRYPAIHLMVRTNKDLTWVPTTYDGYEVQGVVTGEIVAL